MHIKVLGPGCKNCQNLEKNTVAALATLGVDATVEKVTDDAAIAGYGVLRTPGLVVDEEVVASGRVPKSDEIAALLRARMEEAGEISADEVTAMDDEIKTICQDAIDFAEASPELPLEALMEDVLVETTS